MGWLRSVWVNLTCRAFPGLSVQARQEAASATEREAEPSQLQTSRRRILRGKKRAAASKKITAKKPAKRSTAAQQYPEDVWPSMSPPRQEASTEVPVSSGTSRGEAAVPGAVSRAAVASGPNYKRAVYTAQEPLPLPIAGPYTSTASPSPAAPAQEAGSSQGQNVASALGRGAPPMRRVETLASGGSAPCAEIAIALSARIVADRPCPLRCYKGNVELQTFREAINSLSSLFNNIAPAANSGAKVPEEKIVRGEYMDILSLIPSSKDFKLDKIDEDDRRRPMAHTFTNWLQAFCIYANVLTEKKTQLGPQLFKHVDIILESYKSYGGLSWYFYDDRFRQKMSVHPEVTWGKKDVDLWLGMIAPRPVRMSQARIQLPNQIVVGLI
ncbi:hypothetical protein XELAEV_18026855mg [Xenopus laevis]|uniref:Uncharacterized protein n=1 Tax=Xenopus laevis TaxID=8355 RepID=A0A974CWG3_XENLA|nr:hypothetical protein XELAEV_18026855mg [Xenopus laevis]